MDLQKRTNAPSEPDPARPAAPAAGMSRSEMRASDADRDRIADILRDALAEGRLTAEEHAERVEGVLQAKTVGELQPFVRDLPAAGASQAYIPPPVRPTGIPATV